ncbi:hypothetical protein Glove_4g17 [Diversispora epigaea]|uniref:Uncharacterized protein n=1 Tax=Diversispora epigaea TaxID=1348612 RepID=A0A397JPE0_9GLOM|nr:hypothetical protein Glove_4g17 [Diversispora epigaea]
MDCYLKSLQNIVNKENDQRYTKAQELFELYKLASTPKEWNNKCSCLQIHIHYPTVNGTISRTINSVNVVNGVNGNIASDVFNVKLILKRNNQEKCPTNITYVHIAY